MPRLRPRRALAPALAAGAGTGVVHAAAPSPLARSGAADITTTAAAANGAVTLVHHERPSPSAYLEGALQEVRILKASTGRQVLRYRFGQNKRRRITLPVGRYRIRSSTRVCSGTCDRLDAPSFRCRGRFRAQRLNAVSVVISTKVGAKCRVRVRSTLVGVP